MAKEGVTMKKTRETYDRDGNLIGTEDIVIPDLSFDLARKKEYPPVGDQLDAIWKALDFLNREGINLPVSALDMLDNQILAIKAKYPKPKED